MKVILNDTFNIDYVERANEIIEKNFRKRLVLVLPYNQDVSESLISFFKDNNNIFDIKILREGELLNIYKNYTEFGGITHNAGLYGDYLEVTITEPKKEQL